MTHMQERLTLGVYPKFISSQKRGAEAPLHETKNRLEADAHIDAVRGLGSDALAQGLEVSRIELIVIH